MDLILKRNSILLIVLSFLLISCSVENKTEKSNSSNFLFEGGNEVFINTSLSENPTATKGTFLIPVKNKLKLKWKKIFVDVPEEWFLFFCDNNNCYLDFPDSAVLKTMKLNEEKKNPMKLYIEHYDKAGIGLVKVELEELESGIKDTINYHIELK